MERRDLHNVRIFGMCQKRFLLSTMWDMLCDEADTRRCYAYLMQSRSSVENILSFTTADDVTGRE